MGNNNNNNNNRFTTKDSCTWHITHNTESTADLNLKPDQWGWPLVPEKYQEDKACDKRDDDDDGDNKNNNIIIIINA